MGTEATATKERGPGTALELVRPDQRGLMQTAADIGALVNRGGLAVIDLSSPEILKNYNVLAPIGVAVQANPNFTPSISKIKFDRSRGSLYSLDKKWNPRTRTEEWQTASFGKLELLQIAKAMGLRVCAPQIQTGLGANHRDILITAHLQERDVDGTWIDHFGSQMWVHDDEYERTIAECPETKWDGKGDERRQVDMTQAEKDAWIAKNWLQRKKFSLRMTETKALLAAVRGAADVPTKFPVEDLDKPFIVVRYTFTPDPSDIRIVLAQIGAGQEATDTLYGPATDAATGIQYDPATGVVEGTCSEEEYATAAEIHDAMPEQDPVIPRGPHAGQKLSEVCLKAPEYARKKLLPTEALGIATEEWLAYYHGKPEDYSDVSF